jgi:O-antigen ligase
MFAVEVSMQSSIAIFRSMPALANIIVGGVTLVATIVIVPRTYRPMYGYFTSTYLCTVAILVWSIVSLIWSPAQPLAPNMGSNIILEGYPYFVIYVLLAPLLINSIDEWRSSCTVMMIAGTLVVVSIAASPDFSIKGGRIGTVIEGAARTSPLAIAQMGGMLAIFGALSVGGRLRGLQAAIRFGAFVCGALLALLSGTRGQAAFAIGIIAVFLPMSRQLRNIRSYIGTVFAAAMLGLIALVAFNTVMGQTDTNRWQSGAVADATYIRMQNAFELLNAFAVAPVAWVIGLGFNAFSAVTSEAIQGYSHNFYVDVLCEEGIPAFALLVVAFVKTITSARALFRRYAQDPENRSAVAILVAMFVYNALIAAKEGNLWSTWSLFMFMIFINRIEMRAREQDQFGAVEGYARAV